MARVVVADELDLVALGARLALERGQAHEVVGDCFTIADLLANIKSLKPDVVIVGERLDPGGDVLTLVERLRTAAPDARLLLLGVIPDGLYLQDLFTCGIHGYLYRGDLLAGCLAQAVTMVMKGRPYLSPTANAEYLVAVQSPQPEWSLDAEARRVLQLLAQGQHAGQIALELHIPLRRVYSVRRKLKNRFGAVTNEHLISRAAAEGLIHLEV